ncbi:MAG: DUF4097 family beta strand repeat-containing protein [Myxococcota bacterium]
MRILTALFPLFLQTLPGETRHLSPRIDASAAREVSISCVAGEVIVDGAEGNEVSVEADLEGLNTRLVAERKGDRVLLIVEGEGKDSAVHLVVHMPRKLALSAEVVSAEIRATRLEGALGLATVSGDIVLEDVRGEINAKTTSGDVKVRGATPSVRAQTVSGDIFLGLNRAAIRVGTVSGDVRAEAEQLLAASAETVSGDMVLAAGLAPGGAFKLSSQSGDVELRLPSSGGAEVDFDSMSGELLGSDRASGWPRSTVNRTVGGGGAKVHVSTMSGDLSLR